MNKKVMGDSSDHPLLVDEEFEGIHKKALAFERLFEMSSAFENYVSHVQTFPDRAKEFAKGSVPLTPGGESRVVLRTYGRA